MIRLEKLKLVKKYRKESAVIMRRLHKRRFYKRQFRQRNTFTQVLVSAAKLQWMALQIHKAIAMPEHKPNFPSGGVDMAGERGKEVVLSAKEFVRTIKPLKADGIIDINPLKSAEDKVLQDMQNRIEAQLDLKPTDEDVINAIKRQLKNNNYE